MGRPSEPGGSGVLDPSRRDVPETDGRDGGNIIPDAFSLQTSGSLQSTQSLPRQSGLLDSLSSLMGKSTRERNAMRASQRASRHASMRSSSGLPERSLDTKLVTDVFEVHSRGAPHKLLMESFSGSQVTWLLSAWAVGIVLAIAVVIVLLTVGGGSTGTVSIATGPNGESKEFNTVLRSLIRSLRFEIIMGWVMGGMYIALWLDLLYNWLKAPSGMRVVYQRMLVFVLPFFVVGVIPFPAYGYWEFFGDVDVDVSFASLSSVLSLQQDHLRPLVIVGEAWYSLLQGIFLFYVLCKPRLLRSVERPRVRTYVMIGGACAFYSAALCLALLGFALGTNAPVFCGWIRIIRCVQLGVGSGPTQVPSFIFSWILFVALCDLAFLIVVFVEIRRSERALREVVYHLFRPDILTLSFFKLGFILVVAFSWIFTVIQLTTLDVNTSRALIQATGRLFADDTRWQAAMFIFLAFMVVEVILSYPASAKRFMFIIPIQRLVRSGEDLEWKALMSHDLQTKNVILSSSELVLEMQILLMNFSAFAYDFGVPDRTPRDVNVLSKGKYKLVAHITSETTDTHCIVCEAEDSIVISFRGTKSTQNIKSDIQASTLHLRHVLDFDSVEMCDELEDVKLPENTSGIYVSRPVSGALNFALLRRPNLVQNKNNNVRLLSKAYDPAQERYCRVHSGFGEAYISVRRSVIVSVLTLLAAKRRPVFVTGHSLGGALATLCAYHLSKVSSESTRTEIVLVTCGSPRVGNLFFRRHFHDYVKHAWRIHVEGDPVPRVPHLPYVHVGKQIILRIDGEIVADPAIVEILHAKRQPIKVAHHRMWVYRGIAQTFCELYTAPDYIPHMWDLGEFPEDLRHAVKPSAQKMQSAQFLRLNHIIREQFEFESAFDAFKAQVTEKVGSQWKALVQRLLAETSS
ncbi:Lipase [Porphyridium purpureum]|uniref:Lipase n=1 Tax=Porphyridium purpureum TaxID=35688 RepID=A0A5J4YIQ0_PORPP|nr:Lipase [Porphyridium purpureum]|eukprot:POR6619..scf270_19